MNREIIDYLNIKAGTNYRHNTKKVSSVVDARIAEGATLEDFKQAIDNKVSEWRGTNMEQYLRPETLFSNKMQGYTNQKQTNIIEVGNRSELIKEVLEAAGIKGVTPARVTIYDEVLKSIPTEQLPQFAVSIIRSGGEFMRPDQMISQAVNEFEHKIITQNMQLGKKINDYASFLKFLDSSFRNKQICNNLKGLYKPFVTIGMDRDGYLINQFIWKKVSSEDEQSIYMWLYEHQEQIGVIEHIEVKTESLKQIEQKEEPAQLEDSQVVKDQIATLIQKVKVS